MRILLLHGITDVSTTRRTSLNHSLAMLKYAPQHDYVLQCFGQPVTDDVRSGRYDAIIIDTLFLCWRWARPSQEYVSQLLREYAFLGEMDAVKIAFPQDEYDHSEPLDLLLSAYGVDVIYSPCFPFREAFYRRCLQSAEIRPGFCGLVDAADVATTARFAKPFADRAVDVGYRAKDLPPWFGSFGQLKAQIGRRFLAATRERGLRLDIVLGDTAALFGDDWLRHLGNCRFVLGCESGSSILDPNGAIQERSRAYLVAHPDAIFSQVAAACFPNQDREQPFTAISPRLFEAAVAKACQILVPGDYGGALKPYEHYIPLDPEMRNIDEVLTLIRDDAAAQRRIAATWEVLIESGRFGYESYVRDILDAIEHHLRRKRNVAPEPAIGLNEAEIRHALALNCLRQSLRAPVHVEPAVIGDEIRINRSSFAGRVVLRLSSMRQFGRALLRRMATLAPR